MPKVGNKTFPYTKAGKAAAKKEAAKKNMPVKKPLRKRGLTNG